MCTGNKKTETKFTILSLLDKILNKKQFCLVSEIQNLKCKYLECKPIFNKQLYPGNNI